MVFPDIDKFKHISADKVESVGEFRCPHCREVEEENERLRERIETLESLLELDLNDDDEI